MQAGLRRAKPMRKAMSGKTTKWGRQKKPRRVILQPRDREIIIAIFTFRLLTREQIARLFDFHSSRRVNFRLRQLYDHQYLSRFYLPTIRGSSKAIYYLGPKGVVVIAEELGLDANQIKRQRKSTRDLRELFLTHALELNDVRIAFSQAIAKQETMSLERWISDLDCEQKYRVTVLGKNLVRRFRPDGYFRFWYQNKLYSHFIELDRSTETHARFKKKVESYLEFAGLGYYRQRFGVKHFRVLVITLTQERLQNLKKTVETVTDQHFWFATLEQIDPESVFDSIWQQTGRHGRFPLIQR